MAFDIAVIVLPGFHVLCFASNWHYFGETTLGIYKSHLICRRRFICMCFFLELKLFLGYISLKVVINRLLTHKSVCVRRIICNLKGIKLFYIFFFD